jgi:pimeloyl-ACP methyl ester carboxylesterase
VACSSLNDVPTLVVRGERSDVLTAATADRMVAALDDATLVTVPGVGHAPLLTESALGEPIDGLLARAMAVA